MITRETTMARSLRLIFSGGVALGIGLLAQPVFAQQAATPDASSAEPVQTVVVTGSMIKRVDAETAEAVTVIKAETLKDMGITSVEQALSLVTSNNSTLNTASNAGSFSGGASTASLRGLGASKTLVLLDGQRVANNVTLGNAVDLNTIPFAAIERIEVLQEGASALYGSDAIGGVINFITKKSMVGGEVNVEYSKPESHGGNSDTFDFAYGHGSLDEDGYNLMITASFAHQDELRATDRSFSSSGFDPARGLLITNGNFGTTPGSYFDANGNLYQVNGAGCANKFVVSYQGSCQYLYGAATDTIPETKSQTGLVKFTKRVNGDDTFTVQYFLSKFDLITWSGPMFYNFGMTPANNPAYFPTAANSTLVAPGTGPQDLTDPINVAWTDPANNRYFGNSNISQRLLLTYAGNAAGWDYQVNLDWSKNLGKEQVDGGVPQLGLISSNGLISNLINPFGPQSAAGNALLNSAYTNGNLSNGNITLKSLNGNASHELGDAFNAGHPAQVAVGFDLREESINNNTTSLAPLLASATGYSPFSIEGSRNSKAIYSEVLVPVTKKLDVTIADRFDQFSDFGHTQNGKLSFAYQPLDILKIRGAASTGFRAPSLVDEYQANTLGAAAATMNGPGCPAGSGPVFTASNCAAQGLSLYGGNKSLQPETSQNFDLGFILSPARNLDFTLDYYRIIVKNEIQTLPDQAIYANPTTYAGNYHLNNAGTLTQSISQGIDCPTYQAPTCGYIIQTSENTGGISTDGLDLSAGYLMNLAEAGKVHLGVHSVYVMDYNLQTYTGGPQLNLDGRWNQGFQPIIRYQQTLMADWSKDKLGAGLVNHFLSRYQDFAPYADGTIHNVGAYSTWDAYFSYKVTNGLKMVAGINNLANTNPPFSNQNSNWQSGFNSVFSNPIGRAYYLRGTYSF